MGMRTPRSILVFDALAIAIKILFLKLTIALNLNFKKSWTSSMERGILDSYTNPNSHFSNICVLKMR